MKIPRLRPPHPEVVQEWGAGLAPARGDVDGTWADNDWLQWTCAGCGRPRSQHGRTSGTLEDSCYQCHTVNNVRVP